MTAPPALKKKEGGGEVLLMGPLPLSSSNGFMKRMKTARSGASPRVFFIAFFCLWIVFVV
jgi:hypothetical protein